VGNETLRRFRASRLAASFGKRALLLSLLCASSARANGAFPEVSQLVADPTDKAHLVLRSNFGLLTTHDQGQNWDLVCEAGVGYVDIDPPIAVLADGTTIAGLPTGIARSSNAECEFALGSGLTAYVADVTRVPDAALQAAAVSVDSDSSSSQVWRTLDDGRSWSAWGTPLSGVYAATLDVASDAQHTIYVSGVVEQGSVSGVLARSADGGQSWKRFDVPGVSNVSEPYIAAIASNDSDTVYVRLSGSPGHLLVTHDGGQHFDTLLDFAGPMDGFALSPDGQFALAAGRVDGVWRAPTASPRFARLSCAPLRCLSWTESGLFACADELEAGFVIGKSADSGRSFQPLLHLPCVRGPLACDGESSVAQACSDAWPMISEQLGTDCIAAGISTPTTDCSSGGSAGALGDPAGAAGTPASPDVRPDGAAACSFRAPPRTRHEWLTALAAALALGLVRVRNAKRRCSNDCNHSARPHELTRPRAPVRQEQRDYSKSPLSAPRRRRGTMPRRDPSVRARCAR
jgi:hypothetical protein